MSEHLCSLAGYFIGGSGRCGWHDRHLRSLGRAAREKATAGRVSGHRLFGVRSGDVLSCACFIPTLGSFGIVSVLSEPGGEVGTMDDYRSLFWNRPWVVGVFTVVVVSFAGIPLTAGFVGTFYVIATGVDSSHWLFLLLLVISGGIGLFCYVRVIVAMAADGPRDDRHTDKARTLHVSYTDGLVLATLSGLLFGLGLYPVPLIRLLQTMQRGVIE